MALEVQEMNRYAEMLLLVEPWFAQIQLVASGGTSKEAEVEPKWPVNFRRIFVVYFPLNFINGSFASTFGNNNFALTFLVHIVGPPGATQSI